MLGQELAEAAGPVRHGAVADLATGDRQLGNVTGKRREGDLLICLYDARPGPPLNKPDVSGYPRGVGELALASDEIPQTGRPIGI